MAESATEVSGLLSVGPTGDQKLDGDLKGTDTLQSLVDEKELTTALDNGDPRDDNKCCAVPSLLQPILPPRGTFGRYLTCTLICIVIWATLWSIIGVDAMPGGNIFALYILLVAASLGGYLIGIKTKYVTLPPLLGMLVIGFMLRNVPYINIAKDINKDWSSSLRSIALVVILIRSGLGLDISALKRLKFTVLRLAFGPCLAEAVTVAIVAHFLLGIPWMWAFQLGFILGAVSPAVVVPSMLSLQDSGYGVDKGIPTLIMAASSCDDVLAISMFGVFLGIAFSEGNLIFNIFRGPIEIVMGITGGLLFGILLWYLPNKKENSAAGTRSVFLLALGLLSLFGSDRAQFAGAGALGVLTLAAVAGYGWGDESKAPVEQVMGVLWMLMQPLLFGLIGAEVTLDYLDGNLVGRAMATLIVGLIIRISVTYLAVMGSSFSKIENLFCAIAWLPKATVQAAIGSIPLDTARKRGHQGSLEEELGIKIVTIAVLAILVTAPIGAVMITLTGPRFLKKKGDAADEIEMKEDVVNKC